ncbi:MAG: transposase [Dehalococcoidia bacterium]|jgi:REP element-mobilizing transposase RayT|nr:transposase [Dehalococcoidia bacterium]
MAYDSDIHHRRSIRLSGFDYAGPGAYFVTICTQGRVCLFGEVTDDEVFPNDAGRMVQSVWDALPVRFPGVSIDAFVVMPNHTHGILVWTAPAGAPLVDAQPDAAMMTGVGPPVQCDTAMTPVGAPGQEATTRVAPTLGDVVGAYKSLTTVEYVRGVKTMGWQAFSGRLWQRNYYEHVIRDERSLRLIREYIANNPRQWDQDRENPLSPQSRVQDRPAHP